MSDLEKIMGIITMLGAEDESLRAEAQAEIRAMGDGAIPYLNRARGQPKRYPYVEVFRMLTAIGDDLFEKGGQAEISKSIIDTMKFGASSTMKSTPEEVKEIAIQALAKWELEVPEPTKAKVFHCHVCNRSSTELRVMKCFLWDCDNAICGEHAHIIETRFGKFTGTGGAWFCTAEHKEFANKNPSVMQ